MKKVFGISIMNCVNGDPRKCSFSINGAEFGKGVESVDICIRGGECPHIEFERSRETNGHRYTEQYRLPLNSLEIEATTFPEMDDE